MTDGRTRATAITVTYNSSGHLGELLDRLLADPAGPDQIVVVDNASTDGTQQVARRYPVTLVELSHNVGYGAACHAGVDATGADTVVFVNPDTVPRPGWLPPLVAALDEPGVAAAMPTIELADRPGRFNTSGGVLTFVGLSWVSEFGELVPAAAESVDVAFPSGAAFAMHRSVWDELGGLRSDFFMYLEDADLGWRIRMHGLRAVRVPTSMVTHDYAFSRNPGKMRNLERNRLAMLFTNYRRSTLLLLLPVLVATEIGVAVVSVRDRWFADKVRSWWDFLRRFGALTDTYEAGQASRIVGDASVIESLDTSIASIRLVDRPLGTRLVDRFFAGWLRLVLPIVRAIDRRHGLS